MRNTQNYYLISINGMIQTHFNTIITFFLTFLEVTNISPNIVMPNELRYMINYITLIEPTTPGPQVIFSCPAGKKLF